MGLWPAAAATGPLAAVGRRVLYTGNRLVSQSPAAGAEPLLRAGTDADAAGGTVEVTLSVTQGALTLAGTYF